MKFTEEQSNKIREEIVAHKEHIIDWRMGWNFPPIKNMDDAIDFLETIGQIAHIDWLAAIELNEVPAEDVSPAEPFFQIVELLKKDVSQ